MLHFYFAHLATVFRVKKTMVVVPLLKSTIRILNLQQHRLHSIRIKYMALFFVLSPICINFA